jgi:hypothetical protein
MRTGSKKFACYADQSNFCWADQGSIITLHTLSMKGNAHFKALGVNFNDATTIHEVQQA